MSHELEEFDLPRVWKQRVTELEEEGGFDQILISNWPGKGEKREREGGREGGRESSRGFTKFSELATSRKLVRPSCQDSARKLRLLPAIVSFDPDGAWKWTVYCV